MSSFVFPALLVGAIVLHPSSACPYLAQHENAGRGCKDSSLGTAPHPLKRTLQADNIHEDESPTSLNRHRKLQTFNIFSAVFSFFKAIFDFFVGLLFGIAGNLEESGNNGDDTPFDGSVADALNAARQDIIDVMDAPKFVRLAFHDCVGGLCDGCVDISVPDNFGLEGPIDDLQPIVDKYAGQLTRADVWVLAGLTAAEAAQNAVPGGPLVGTPPTPQNVTFPMQYVNRPTCDNAKGGPARQLPSAHFHTSATVEFFANNFGFNDEETAAIIGAHTLGQATLENSGFDGPNGWVPTRNRLDNRFYNVLLNGTRVGNDFQLELQDNTGSVNFPSQYLWRRGTNNTGQFMLNVDMALMVDLGNGLVDPVTGYVSCNLNTQCPDSPLLPFAIQYARDNLLWVEDFRDAFTKMTSIGCEGVCTPL